MIWPGIRRKRGPFGTVGPMEPDIDALADAFLAARIDHDPLEASAYGLPGADDQLPDLSAAAQRSYSRKYSEVAEAAKARQQQGSESVEQLSEIDRQTLDFVAVSAGNFAAVTEVPSTEFTVTDFHVSPMSILLVVMPQLPLDTEERRSGYLARLAAVPTYLEQAGVRHLDGVASGRRTVARGVEGAIKQLDDVISDPGVSGIRRTPEPKDSDFVQEQAELIESAVLPAFVAYRELLENDILPTARPDERPGICWLADGSAMYQRLVAFNTSTHRTPDELHKLGLEVIAQLDEEYAEVGKRLWAMSDPDQIRARLRSDPGLRFSTRDEVVQAAVNAVLRAEFEAPNWFGRVPKEPCAVEAISPALERGSAAAYYLPGAVDGSRKGTYFVNSSQPDERPRYAAESVAFHEAVPGHHFQLTIELESAGPAACPARGGRCRLHRRMGTLRGAACR
jgi:uncharacterized protein (DUF885 family)